MQMANIIGDPDSSPLNARPPGVTMWSDRIDNRKLYVQFEWLISAKCDSHPIEKSTRQPIRVSISFPQPAETPRQKSSENMPHRAKIAEPFVLEDKVVTLHDDAWIADHTELYINWVHSLSEQEVVKITDDIYRRTGFEIHVSKVSMDDLLGQRIRLSGRDRVNFMGGRPVWRLPAMFVRGGKGDKRKSPVGQTLSRAMAIQAVMGKATVNALLEIEYARRRNLWPARQNHTKAHEHAHEIFVHALGTPQFVDQEGDIVDEPNNVVLRTTLTHREVLAIKRYKWESAQTIARMAIDKPGMRGAFGPCYGQERPHIYASILNRIADEIRHSEQAFGFEPSGLAMGAWYHRVVTALRLGASLFAELDKVRTAVAKSMLDANLKFQALRRQPNPSRASLRDIERLRTLIAEQVETFDAKVAGALARVDSETTEPEPQHAGNVFSCIASLDAAIIAFFGGVNARHTIPGICPDLPPSFTSVLDSLIWLGQLHRGGMRDLEFESAYFLLQAVDTAETETELGRAIKGYLDMGMSFMDNADRAALIGAAAQVVSTGDPRTVMLHLRDLAPAVPPAPVAIEVGQEPPALEEHAASSTWSKLRLLSEEAARNEPERYWVFKPELGMYQSMFPELSLQQSFLTFPPAYQQQWAGDWRVDRDADDRFVNLVKRRPGL